MGRIAEAEGAGSDDCALSIAGQLIDPRFCDDVHEFLRESGKGRELRAKLQEQDPDVLALCILQTALSSIAKKNTLRGTHMAIAEAMHDECWPAGRY